MTHNTKAKEIAYKVGLPPIVVHNDAVPMPIRIDDGGAVRVRPTRVTLTTVMFYY